MFLINKNKNDDDKKVSYTQLIKDIKEGKIQKVEMKTGSKSIKVQYKGTDEKDTKTGIVPDVQAFVELVQDRVQEGNTKRTDFVF